MRQIIFFLSVVLLASCKNEGCTDFGAENYDPEATINDGSCILTRDKFLGQFQVSSDCFSDNYSRTISATQNEYIVVITNLADTLGDVEARVFGENITIDTQTIENLITIEGAGVYTEDNAISITYRIRDYRLGTEIIHDCMEWCTKQ
ncbi:hypothetical protein OAL15_03400 [Flavobacteriales bacterium]|nr:hypothetical protein [Flavobacteriales bacterium]